MCTMIARAVCRMEVRTRLFGSFLPPCSMAFMSSSRKAEPTSSPTCAERWAVISRRKWVVRSAASSLQRTSSVIQSGWPETTRISSCQGPVEIAEGALPDRRQDALRIGVAGEDDFGFGADGTHAAQPLQAVEAVVPLSGQHQIDVASTQEVERL